MVASRVVGLVVLIFAVIFFAGSILAIAEQINVIAPATGAWVTGNNIINGSLNVTMNYTSSTLGTTTCSILAATVVEGDPVFDSYAANDSVINNTETVLWWEFNESISANDTAWKISCTDLTSSAQRTATVDLTHPNISITAPTNGTWYPSTDVSLTFTPSDNLAPDLECNYTIDGTLTAIGFMPNGTANTSTMGGLANSSHKVNVTCFDLAGIANTSNNVEFFVDDESPVVSISSDSPLKGTWYNSTFNPVNITFNATDSFSDTVNCTIDFWYQESETSWSLLSNSQAVNLLGNNTNNITSFLVATDGNYTVNVSCLDKATNEGRGTTDFSADVNVPNIPIVSPADTYNTSTAQLTFSLNMDASGEDYQGNNYTLIRTLDGVNTSIWNGTNTTDLFYDAFNVSTEGVHSVNYTCRDRVGNENTSLTQTFTYDQSPPNVTLHTPINGSIINFTYGEFNFSFVDNLDTTASCTVYLDGANKGSNTTTLNNTATIVNVTDLVNHNHLWEVNCTDSAGNKGNSSVFNVSFLVNTSLAMWAHPVGAQEAGANFSLYANYTIEGTTTQLNTSSPVCNITIYNITAISNPLILVNNTEMIFNGYFNYTWNASSEDTLSWNVSCLRGGYISRSGGETYQITSLPDLRVQSHNAPADFLSETGRTITITVENVGNNETVDVNVSCYKNNTYFDSYSITSIEPNGGTGDATCTWDGAGDGGQSFKLNITIDPYNEIEESNKGNNEALVDVDVIQTTAMAAWDNSTGEEVFVGIFASFNKTLSGASSTKLTSRCNMSYTDSGGGSGNVNMTYDSSAGWFYNDTTFQSGRSVTWTVTCNSSLYQTQSVSDTFITAGAPTVSGLGVRGTYDWANITTGRNVWWNVENITVNATVSASTSAIDTVWLNITNELTNSSSILYMTNITSHYFNYTGLGSNGTWYNITLFVNDTLGQVGTDSKRAYSEIRGPEFALPDLFEVKQNENIILNFTARSSFNITNITILLWQPGENTSTSPWDAASMNKSSEDLSNYSVAYSYNFTSTGTVGDYYFNVTAYDSRNSSASSVDYLDVWAPSVMNGSIVSPTNFTFYRPGTTTVLKSENHTTETEYNISLHNRTYDLLVSVEDSSVRFDNISLMGGLTDRLKVERVDANDTDVTLPMTRENKGFQGVYVMGTNLTFGSANITLSYPATATSGRVRIYRCSAWNETNNCTAAADWVDIYASESASLSFDFTNRLVTTEVDSFSAYVSGQTSCGDNSCDASWGETTSSCSNDCSSGGGTTYLGGGGGSSTSTTTVVEGDDDDDEDESSLINEELIIGTHSIKIELYQGEEGTISIRVKNPSDKIKTLTIAASPNIREFLEFEPNSLEIAPGSTSYFNVHIKPKLTTEVKSYFGEFVVSDGTAIDRASVNIIILESREKLLDLEISPLAEVVNPGEQFEIEVNLYVLGDIKKLYTRLTLQLIDQDVREVVEEIEKNILVQTSYSDVAIMNISEDISLGRYLVKGIVTYTDANNVTREVVDLAYVTVDQPFLLRTVAGIPIWAIVLGIVMMLIGGALVFLYERKKTSEKRYLEKIDFSQLPQPGANSAFVGKIAESDMRAFMDMDKFKVHSLVAGATGSGKTIAAQVLVEEALEKGTSVVVLDPTAQWTGFLRPNKNDVMFKLYPGFDMKQGDAKAFKGNLHIVESEHEEIDFKKYLKNEGTITVFCLNRLTPHQIDIFVTNSIKTVFKADLDESQKLRLLIVYDEIHRLLPKFGGTGEGFIQVERACREFRKWGIGLVMISQVLSDFKGEIKANIGTEIQMRTRYEDDLERIKLKYGEDMQKSVLKASLGTGMVQNAMYNKGRPYFVTFRPILHSLHRLTNDELDLYQKYNKQIGELRNRLATLKEGGVDIFDVELELNLAQSRLERGAFNIVDIYLESIKTRVDKHKPGDKVI